jgi:hypothetical protein
MQPDVSVPDDEAEEIGSGQDPVDLPADGHAGSEPSGGATPEAHSHSGGQKHPTGGDPGATLEPSEGSATEPKKGGDAHSHSG